MYSPTATAWSPGAGIAIALLQVSAAPCRPERGRSPPRRQPA